MQISAGLVPYRWVGRLELLVAHPGGPFWARKHEGAWSVVKGLVEDGEGHLTAAAREFEEETGWPLPANPEFIDLGEVRLKSGKVVRAWAFEADFDPDGLEPGTFEMEWRGSIREFPEIDRVVWATAEEARNLLNPAQAPFVDRLLRALSDSTGAGGLPPDPH